MHEFIIYFLIFLAFCVCNFLFNVLWKIVEGRMQLRFTDQKIDTIYAALVRKLLSVKGDLTKEDGNNEM